jgi:hypothetical protein
MSVTLTAAATAELNKYSPRIYMTAEIIKNYYATPTVIDVTEYVISFGVTRLNTTLAEDGWEVPTLVTVLNNAYRGNVGYFNYANANSIWKSAPSKRPEGHVLRIRQYVRTDAQDEKVFEYVGRVQRPRIVSSREGGTCELTTRWEPAEALAQNCTKRDGAYTDYNGATSTYYDVDGGSGNILPHPTIAVAPTWDGAAPRTKYYTDLTNMSSLMLVDMINQVTGEVEQVLTWINFGGLSTTGTKRVASAMPYTLGDSAYHIRWYNPISWHNQHPGTITYETILYAAGVDSSFIDASSWTPVNTYFAGVDSPYGYQLQAACYDRTYLDFLLEMLGYAPEMYLSIDNYGIINAHLMDELANLTSRITYTEIERNFVALEEIDDDTHRLATRIEIFFGAFVTLGITETVNLLTHWSNWIMDRQPMVGGNRDQGGRTDQTRQHWAVDESSTNSSVELERHADLDLPWIPGGTSGFHKAQRLTEEWFEIYELPLQYALLRVDHKSCFIELNDCVTLDIPGDFFDSQKMLVVGKEYNIDTMESLLLLKSIEWEQPA